MFRAILTKNDKKREEDIERLAKMIERIEKSLKDEFLLDLDELSIADFYFTPHII